MNDRAIREANAAVMMGVTAVAVKFAEALIAKGIFSRDDGQAVLRDIVEELRDGTAVFSENNEAGPLHTMANAIEAMATGLFGP